jgi:uncharacterized protein (DUF58 family)
VEWIKDIFPANRFYLFLFLLVGAFVVGFMVPESILVARMGLVVLIAAVIADLLLLFSHKNGLNAQRALAERFSNGDNNAIRIVLSNGYGFEIDCLIYDEIPFQFQERDLLLKANIQPAGKYTVDYTLRPVTRGTYVFGALNVYVTSPLRLIQRRYRFAEEKSVAVYPSYNQMRRYELLTVYDRLSEAGVKKVRRVGQTFEFDQIRDYVAGDDYRAINWQATARKAVLMVNQYQDEITNHVYNIVDCSRSMQKVFNGMTLLDYAINTSLVLSNTAILKADCAGLITFSQKIHTFIPADKRRRQMHKILEALYRQGTEFLESDYRLVYATIKRKLTRRCLLLIYSNYESFNALKRQLPFLKELARLHLLVVLFFEDKEMLEVTRDAATSIEQIYTKIIAEELLLGKKQIVRELQQVGIHAILTTPEQLTVNTLNKYLELKSRRYI